MCNHNLATDVQPQPSEGLTSELPFVLQESQSVPDSAEPVGDNNQLGTYVGFCVLVQEECERVRGVKLHPKVLFRE